MAKIRLISEKALRKKYANADKASVLLPEENMLWLPSRIVPFNWQIGGGIPYGRIMEIFGWESSGKSLLAYDFSYTTQALGGIVLWADAEGSFTNNWAEMNGLDPSQVELYWGKDIEGIADWCKDMIYFYRSRLVNNEPILLVIDSIAAGETEDNIEIDLKGGKAEMGNRAKAWDKFLRRRQYLFQKMGVCVIMINQVRSKLNASMFELAETTPGGKAAAFYATQRIAVTKGRQIKEGDIKLGNNTTLGVRKNKVAPPKNSIKTEVHYIGDRYGHVGFSRYHGLPEILLEMGILSKKGNKWVSGDKLVASKKDDVIPAIYENTKMRRYLIKKSDINTISLTRNKIQGIDENLFQVKATTEEE